MRRYVRAAAAAALFAIVACAAQPDRETGAGITVLTNADIVTVDESLPSAEAVALRDGRILAVGTAADVLREAGPLADVRDLGGATLVPGFIDAHGHLAIMAQAAANPAAPWIVGFGYDDTFLAEQRHPDRHDLDAVSADVPVLLVHTSAHFVTCNTACLKLASVTADTPDPAGGVIRREADGAPNGVFEETALYLVMKHLPAPTQDMRIAGLAAIQKVYAKNGITTVQDGASTPQQIEDMRKAAAEGKLYLDIVAFQHFHDGASIGEDFAIAKAYDRHFRVGGIKLVLDGSVQGKTAWLTRPYLVPPPGQTSGYSGYGTYTDESVHDLMAEAHARGIQVIAHVNGDRAIDQLLAIEGDLLAANPQQALRTVAIHAQTAREDQLDRMAELGIIPSFFASHPFFWGDWHRDQAIGPERAAFISPLVAAKARGLAYTMHTDSPVVPPDIIHLLWVAMNRETRSGDILGPDQRASALDALRAVTLNAARQYSEEADKGSITPGKRADFVILSNSPLKVPPAEIRSITVLETIKDGKIVYKAAP